MELYTERSITESHLQTSIHNKYNNNQVILIKHGIATDTLHGCYIYVFYTLS